MRRSSRAAVCLVALLVGFAIPACASAQAASTGPSTSAAGETGSTPTSPAGPTSAPGSPTGETGSTATGETGSTSTSTGTTGSTATTAAGGTGSTGSTDTASAGSTGGTGSTGDTGSTGSTGTSDDTNGVAKSAERQALREWGAALLALVLLGICLRWIDRTLVAQRKGRAQGAPPGWPAKFNEHPVPRFLLIGADGRWSTTKTLASIWTASLVWAIATLALSHLLGAPKGWEAFAGEEVSWQYLLLLGGPVGAAIGAQSLVLLRSKEGAEVKTEPPEGTAFSQIYTDDQGKLDLIDVQYLAFNTLSILVFLVVFVSDASAGLPTFPGILAALTGATAAAYLARKTALRANPVITSIAPPVAAPGEVVRLWGVNLTPPKEAKPVDELNEEQRLIVAAEEARTASIDVFFDGVPAPSVKPAGAQAGDLSEAYDVRVPAGAPVKSGVQVIVNSRGNQGHKSDAYTEFTVAGPVLASVVPPRARPGAKVKIWGTKLGAGGEAPSVFFDDLPGTDVAIHSGSDSTQDMVEATVPELAAGTVKVKLVTASGLTSNEIDLDLATDVRIVDAPQVLALGPNTPALTIKGQGFVTQPGLPLYASVILDGQTLTVGEGKWRPDEVTADLPTDPAELKRIGFADKDEVLLVVRNDQGYSSAPWKLKLEVVEPVASGDAPTVKP